MTPRAFLEKKYERCMSLLGSSDTIKSSIQDPDKSYLDTILEKSESAKGVLTVVITSIVYKNFNPKQDIRNHQDSIPNGYSGRTFDNKYITPFLKNCRFPAMAESGWLTRSLEQKQPYTMSYSGAITPEKLKSAFLNIMDQLQKSANPESYLDYLLQGLIIKRNKQIIDLAKPTALPINTILYILDSHFNSFYKSEGASRLPVLAFYAIYQCLIKEAKRFERMSLMPIESHTSADTRSGRIGDIEIRDENGRAFEAVEVKHGIEISLQLVQDAYSKFQTTPVNRYYILTTASASSKEELVKIDAEIQKIRNVHGCQLIVNGIMPSLRYYLRLLGDTYEFIECYVNLIEDDSALKFEHKQRWNEIISLLG